jgi:hypothetical protein
MSLSRAATMMIPLSHFVFYYLLFERPPRDESEGATLTGYSDETESGKGEHELEMALNRRSRDGAISPDGAVLEVGGQVESITRREWPTFVINQDAFRNK